MCAKPTCPCCGSENIRSYDNESIYHRFSHEEINVQFGLDTELHLMCDCGNCNHRFKTVGTITYPELTKQIEPFTMPKPLPMAIHDIPNPTKDKALQFELSLFLAKRFGYCETEQELTKELMRIFKGESCNSVTK